MNHALEFVDVAHGLVDLLLGVVSLAHSQVQLLAHAVASSHQRLSLLVEHSDPGVLRKALLFPLRESSVVLVDGALLSLPELLVLSDGVLDIFVLPLDALVVHHLAVDVVVNVSDVRLLHRNLDPHRLDLLLDVD